MNGISGRRGVTPEQLAQHRTTVAGVADAVWSPLYDYQTYATAGALTTNFFAVPAGQSGKTLADTNMQVAGQLPRGNRFLCVGIEVEFWPSNSPGLRLAAVPTDAQFARNWDDVYAVLKSGFLSLNIQQRVYAQDAPLMKFPPQTRLTGVATYNQNDTTAATVGFGQIEYATACGAGYSIIPVYIESTQFFNVQIQFPALVPTPSGQDARWGVRLLGNLIRDAQ